MDEILQKVAYDWRYLSAVLIICAAIYVIWYWRFFKGMRLFDKPNKGKE